MMLVPALAPYVRSPMGTINAKLLHQASSVIRYYLQSLPGNSNPFFPRAEPLHEPKEQASHGDES
jgi:hypothetical protein